MALFLMLSHAPSSFADGIKVYGRRWKVDWATREDFKFFGWKWFEGSPARSPSRYGSSATAMVRWLLLQPGAAASNVCQASCGIVDTAVKADSID